MTTQSKNLLSKMQGILRKGTVETLCTLLLILFVVASCKEPEPIDKPDGNGIKGTETTLQGTKWKLVGIVDARSGDLQKLEPKDCNECYTIIYESDSAFIGQININTICVKYEINYEVGIFHIIGIGGTEALDYPDDAHLYRQILLEIQSFIIKDTYPRKLHLYYNDGKNYLEYDEKGG